VPNTGHFLAMARPEGLHDDEEIVAMLSVRFCPGMPATIDPAPPTSVGHANMGASSGRASIVQRHAYAHWARATSAAGFPIAGPEMILGITQTRLLVWRPAFIRSRPRRYAGALPLARIQSAGVHRKVFSSVLTLLFEQGTIVSVETLRGSRLRRFAAHIPAYNEHKSR
jgi:hypothetical protein